MVVKRIGVWSVARMYGAMLATMGLFIGLIVAIGSMVGAGLAGGMQDAPTWIAPALGVGAIVLLPILYGVMGMIGGAIGALLYNLFAALVGGVVLETE